MVPPRFSRAYTKCLLNLANSVIPLQVTRVNQSCDTGNQSSGLPSEPTREAAKVRKQMSFVEHRVNTGEFAK